MIARLKTWYHWDGWLEELTISFYTNEKGDPMMHIGGIWLAIIVLAFLATIWRRLR